MKGRPYQLEAVQSIWDYFTHGGEGNPVVAMPTGTGKSIVIALFLQSVYASYPRQKVLLLTHVKELIQQNYEKLLAIWPGAPAGIYSAGLGRRDLMQRIIFAGIASMIKNMHLLGKVDLILIDECHLVSPNDQTMYRKLIAFLQQSNPYLKIIGFTATDYRLGYGRIIEGDDRIFTDTCFDITTTHAFNRLIAEGYLAPLIPKRTETVLDLDGVHIRGGEYVSSELQSAIDKESITRAAIEEALAYKDTRHSWLAFASGVEHSIHVAEMLNDYGVRSIAIHSKMKSDERDTGLKLFKAGYYQCAVNNNILTTGFDHPPIDLILGLRPTQSTVLWVQMLGRGTRPYDPANLDLSKPSDAAMASVYPHAKSNCLVLDFAGNSNRLGPINDPVIPRPKGKGGGEAPVKECPKCKCFMHASVRWCTGVHDDGTCCDHEFVFETKLMAGASTTELIKGDLPEVEVFKVDHINYSKHEKQDRPDSMRVTYYCGYRTFSEFVPIEHALNAGGARARKWVQTRLPEGATLPTTTAELIQMAPQLKAATHLRIWINKKYPEILVHCFDGTAFGKEMDNPINPPSVEAEGGAPYLRTLPPGPKTPVDPDVVYDDDDIPF